METSPQSVVRTGKTTNASTPTRKNLLGREVIGKEEKIGNLPNSMALRMKVSCDIFRQLLQVLEIRV